MAAGKDVFRRNGFELSWASKILKVQNEEFFGCVGADYEEKLDRAIVRALDRGGPPRGLTRGQYSVEGSSLKFVKGSAMAFYEFLAMKASDGKSFGIVPFSFTLQYVENDISITEELIECYVSGRKASAAPGPDALVEEVPITVLYAKLTTPNIKGMTLFDNRNQRF